MTGLAFCRDMFDRSRTSSVNQGSIFNFAFHEDYPNSEILGVVITARCDIDHAKSKKYSYLPVIPLRLWMDTTMPALVRKRATKSRKNALDKALSEIGLSERALTLYGMDRVLDVAQSKTKPKVYDGIKAKVGEYLRLMEARTLFELTPTYEPDIKSVLKDIAENKVMDYFLVDEVDGYGACIINLREVSHLDRLVAEELGKGIEIAAIKDHATDVPPSSVALGFRVRG